MICIFGRPHRRDRRFGAASARQFFLGDGELVGLAGLDHEFAPVALPDPARNRAPEMTVTQTVEDDLHEAIERLAELRSTGLRRRLLGSVRYALCSRAFMSLMVAENASGGTRRPGRKRPARRRGASGGRGRRKPCAGLRRAGRSGRSLCSAGSRRDRSRASRTRRCRPLIPACACPVDTSHSPQKKGFLYNFTAETWSVCSSNNSPSFCRRSCIA